MASNTDKDSSGFSWKGAFIGAGFSIGAEALLGTLIAVLSQLVWIARGATREEAATLLAASFYSTIGLIGFLLVTVAAGVCGGLISASYGPARSMLQAGAAGAISLLFPLVILANPMSQLGPTWYLAISFVLPLGSALLGGHFYPPQSPMDV